MYNVKNIEGKQLKKFNLFKEIIVTQKHSLLQAINTSKVFGIDIHGQILYEPFSDDTILIYKKSLSAVEGTSLLLNTTPSFSSILGKNYQVVEDGERVLIKAFSNWQEIIKMNDTRASYDDTSGDGIDSFSCSDLEEIGWHASEFKINYRMLVERLEENSEGTLLCIEQEEPYQFSGLGFITDNPHAKKVLFEFCHNKIKESLANDPLFKKELLSDDELEAAEFFGLL